MIAIENKRPDLELDEYEYNYNMGFESGNAAFKYMAKGKTINHGNLFSAIDAYAIGYRKGLNTCQK
jgi:hypothetical protein